MKTTENIELQDLKDKDLKEINGGSDLTYWLFHGIGWFAAMNGDGYETMHDSGLLAYRH